MASLLAVVQVVRPATVLRWHRAGFRAFWRAKDKAAAQPLIKYLTSPTAISVIKTKAMEPG
jgi:hypothetical protein